MSLSVSPENEKLTPSLVEYRPCAPFIPPEELWQHHLGRVNSIPQKSCIRDGECEGRAIEAGSPQSEVLNDEASDRVSPPNDPGDWSPGFRHREVSRAPGIVDIAKNHYAFPRSNRAERAVPGELEITRAAGHRHGRIDQISEAAVPDVNASDVRLGLIRICAVAIKDEAVIIDRPGEIKIVEAAGLIDRKRSSSSIMIMGRSMLVMMVVSSSSRPATAR